jgi:hypothetical protein
MKHSIFALAALGFLLTACASYSVDGVKYGTAAEATAAYQATLARYVAGVKPSAERLGGRALIAIPDRAVMQANGVRQTGPRPASEEQVRYIVDSVEANFMILSDGLQAGQVFDQTSVIRAVDTNGVLIGDHDFKVWLVGESYDRWQWYVSRKGDARREPVSVDRGLPREERLNSFNVSVVKAGVLLGAPATGAK